MNIQDKDVQMKNEIMQRVTTIHTLRRLRQNLYIKGVFFVSSIIALNFLVSVPSVLFNMMKSQTVISYSNYLVEAFIHTSAIVQLVLVLGILIFILLVIDIVRNIKNISLLKTI